MVGGLASLDHVYTPPRYPCRYPIQTPFLRETKVRPCNRCGEPIGNSRELCDSCAIARRDDSRSRRAPALASTAEPDKTHDDEEPVAVKLAVFAFWVILQSIIIPTGVLVGRHFAIELAASTSTLIGLGVSSVVVGLQCLVHVLDSVATKNTDLG